MLIKWWTGILCLSTLVFANINVVVSILPQKSFVEAIGGEFVSVEVMVLPGNSPHSYEPKPSQMKAISNAHLYMTIGVEFEGAWMQKFANQNKAMHIIDNTKGIKKLFLKEAAHHPSTTPHAHEHKGEDPHVWTSPSNIKIIAKNILDALVQADIKHKASYEANYQTFINKVEHIDAQIKQHLSALSPRSKFMVFHPSWGYFAEHYGLEQIAIEVEGKEPKVKELAYILEEAKEEKVTAIFAQPEFSDKSAKQIAQALGIRVIKVSPLSTQWDETLLQLASAIAAQKMHTLPTK